MVRFKNRYVTVEVKQEKASKGLTKLSSKELSRHILGAVSRLYGEFGFAAVRNGFSASYCNEITQIAIIRVRHGPHKLVTSSIPSITRVGNVQVKINTLYVGGTLHQCYKVILKHQKESLLKLLPSLKEEERSNFEREILNLDGFLAKNQRDK
uniref:Ribonuclease P/MRP protein subunit POP5 n=1 Tax=Panstrongylus lignarius TaxID=156445 RepID=A0A224XZ36_9HEMI